VKLPAAVAEGLNPGNRPTRPKERLSGGPSSRKSPACGGSIAHSATPATGVGLPGGAAAEPLVGAVAVPPPGAEAKRGTGATGGPRSAAASMVTACTSTGRNALGERGVGTAAQLSGTLRWRDSKGTAAVEGRGCTLEPPRRLGGEPWRCGAGAAATISARLGCRGESLAPDSVAEGAASGAPGARGGVAPWDAGAGSNDLEGLGALVRRWHVAAAGVLGLRAPGKRLADAAVADRDGTAQASKRCRGVAMGVLGVCAPG